MQSTIPLRRKELDLWKSALAQLPQEDKDQIDFRNPDKNKVVNQLLRLTEDARRKCMEKSWRYKRSSGANVSLRDVFTKIIRGLQLFKDIGDVIVQYDPGHAALPWAGVRFLLQLAVNDTEKFGFVIEGVADIAEILPRCAIQERIALVSESAAHQELKRALVHLYIAILKYISKAKCYLSQKTLSRIFKSAILGPSDFEDLSQEIIKAQGTVDSCQAIVTSCDQTSRYDYLKGQLSRLDEPLRQMANAYRLLKELKDGLDTSKRREILEWISKEPVAEHHKQAKKDVLEKTGRWLLSSAVFQHWERDTASSIIWLHGIPGSGKTKLVSMVIENYLEPFRKGTSPSPAYFYCSRDTAEPNRSNPDAILASLASQLSSLDGESSILEPAQQVYDKYRKDTSSTLSFEETRDLIVALVGCYDLTTIIIDALDECEERARLLNALESILQNSTRLVKIFVSSRDDQDIVCRLDNYPNLSISADNNAKDIQRFIKLETDKLIREKLLLRSSENCGELRIKIIENLTENAGGMFRWASMQLQALCDCESDEAILERLGRLPPKLAELYTELHDRVLSRGAEADQWIAKATLSWLLCAQRQLSSREFLAFVSIRPSGTVVPATKGAVLSICSNLVVFDDALDTFRFAHLSVREFLEGRPEYETPTINALAAEICLLRLFCNVSVDKARQSLPECLGSTLQYVSGQVELDNYSTTCWASHCRDAKQLRHQGRLSNNLKAFMSNDIDLTSPIYIWQGRLPRLLSKYSVNWHSLQHCVASKQISLFTCCAFNLPDFLDIDIEKHKPDLSEENYEGFSALSVAAVCCSLDILALLLSDSLTIISSAFVTLAASCKIEVMQLLLDRRPSEVQIIDAVVIAAAGNSRDPAMMQLLLDRRPDEVHITKAVVIAAASGWNGKTVMQLLLDRRPDEVHITESVVIAAAENDSTMMQLLLDRRPDEVHITEAVLEAAASGWNGKTVTQLLLDRRPDEVQITEAVVIAAAGKSNSAMMQLLLDRWPDEVQITEALVIAAAGNSNGPAMMQLLLDHWPDEVHITEAVVIAAAGGWEGEAVMQLLLDHWPDEVHITEAVVIAAAEGWGGEAVMQLLLDYWPDEVHITEAVVIAAAGSEESKAVMQLLLDRRPAEVHITEAVVIAAAGSEEGKAVMQLLLDRRPAEVHITEAVVIAAAGSWGGKAVMQLLLDYWPDEVHITEAVVIAAAGGWEGRAVLRLLLNRLPDEVHITEAVLKAAAKGLKGSAVMQLLLDRRPDEVQITEEVIKAAFCSGKIATWSDKLVLALCSDRHASFGNIVRLAMQGRPNVQPALRFLFKTGKCRVDIVDDKGQNSLMAAIDLGLDELAEYLLTLDQADLAACDQQGMTTLMLASRKGSNAMVQQLLDRQVDVSARDSLFDQTAFLWAVQEGHGEVVETLLEHYLADLDEINLGGCTAIQLAHFNHHYVLEALLIERGASVPDDFYGLELLFST